VKISERVRKLESERVKDAHQCAVIALVDLLTFLPFYSLTVRLRTQTQWCTDERRPRINSRVRQPSSVYRLTSNVLLLTPDALRLSSSLTSLASLLELRMMDDG
jgi:hypothetical protein